MTTSATHRLPCAAGIGLRTPHHRELLESLPKLSWLEVHSENFFGGGAPLRTLLSVRERYPISLHGVGMGLGSTQPLAEDHLAALKSLCAALQPAAVSEHLSWNAIGGVYINDLLPFPYTQAALSRVASRIQKVQETLGRRLLIENISSYLCFQSSEMDEADFLAQLVQRTGCGILLDIENLHVNACNLGVDAALFISKIPAAAVHEYHLAGYEVMDGCLVDTHSRPVAPEVWSLYEFALQTIGPRPTLIEWDADLPDLKTLLSEAAIAQHFIEKHYANVA